MQRVFCRRADDDGGAVLIVMKHRDVEALAQFALHLEAFGGLDVFEVDAAKRRLQRGDDLDQTIRIGFVQLQIEHVDAGEFLEQHRLAFHHRLGGQRADVAQTQDRAAVGDHRDQIAAGREAEGIGRVFDDLFTGGGHAR